MIIHRIFFGTYPISASVRVVRRDIGAKYGREFHTKDVTRWVPNDYEVDAHYGVPCLAIDAKLWDWLAVGMGLLEGAFTCRDCGGVEPNRYFDHVQTELLAARLCHTCNFWNKRHSELASGQFAIIDGRAYFIKPDEAEGYQGFVGFGGAKHVIRFNDGREVVSRNLWFNGDVPDHWRARLPDNARFVERDKQPMRGHDRFTGDGP